jgi:hypothetical protein
MNSLLEVRNLRIVDGRLTPVREPSAGCLLRCPGRGNYMPCGCERVGQIRSHASPFPACCLMECGRQKAKFTSGDRLHETPPEVTA